jgi:hypothetical protein
LQKIKALLEKMPTTFTGQEYLEASSDDYDSDDSASEPETASTTTATTSTSKLEPAALSEYIDKFNFQIYSKQSISKLSQLLLYFFILTMKKDATNQFDHELLSYVSLISMDQQAKSFKAPGHIAQAYSAIIYYFQCIVIEAATQKLGVPSGCSSESSSDSENTSERASENPSISKRRHLKIQQFMAQYFHNHAYSGLANIVGWRALAMNINITTSGPYNKVSL